VKTNPNKANMPAFGRKSDALSLKQEEQKLKDNTEGTFEEVCLKKQSQFHKGVNECKYIIELVLRKI
jgi:hypothetical protein